MKVHISPDKLRASLTITEDRAAYPTADQILMFLKEHRVVYGIDEALIHSIADTKEPVDKLLCANSLSPGMDELSLIDWKISVDKAGRPSGAELERVDYKRIHIFHNVHADQVLAVIKSTQPTITLKTVTGEEGEIPLEQIRFPAGRNTHISQDGKTLHADIDGAAFWENGLLHVDRVYHVKGDVNYATGNIKFDGPVVIDGDVRSGFRVEAQDSIYIGGNVEAANIYSQKGDVTVQYGVVGKNRAKILAGGSLTCGYIQDATVGVRKNVVVKHYIINATITAGGRIEVSENEGMIRGGDLTAEKGIIAKNIGSPRNILTELKIRNNGENEYQNQLWELSRSRSELMVRVSALKKRHSFLMVLGKQVGSLSPAKDKEKLFLADEIKRLEEKLAELGNKEIVLQKEASKERMNREILVFENIYPYVDIDISGQGFQTEQTMKAVKIFRFKDEIIIESLLDMTDSSYDIFVPESKT